MRVLTLSTIFVEERRYHEFLGVEVFRDTKDLLTRQPQMWYADCQGDIDFSKQWEGTKDYRPDDDIEAAEDLRDTRIRELQAIVAECGGEVPKHGTQWFCEDDGCWRYLSWTELPEG